MNIQILEVDFGTPAFDELLNLRNDILRIPLGLEFFERDITQEYDQIHLAAYDDQSLLLGCLTMQIKSSEEVKMRQVAVGQNLQKKGIGKRLVEASEQWSQEHGYRKIILHARNVAVPFYLKLNYNKVGAEFEEVNIKHWRMEKEL